MPARKCKPCMMNAQRRLLENLNIVDDYVEELDDELCETSVPVDRSSPRRRIALLSRRYEKLISKSALSITLLLFVWFIYNEFFSCVLNYLWRFVYFIAGILVCTSALVALTCKNKNYNISAAQRDMEFGDERFADPPTIGRFGLYLVKSQNQNSTNCC